MLPSAKPPTLAKGKFHYEVMSNSSWQDVLLYLPLQFGGREAQLPRKYSQLKAADWTQGRDHRSCTFQYHYRHLIFPPY